VINKGGNIKMSELDNVKIGDRISIVTGVEKTLTQNIIDNMKFYEELNPGKNAIYNGKITRDFEHWLLNFPIKKRVDELKKQADKLKELEDKLAQIRKILE